MLFTILLSVSESDREILKRGEGLLKVGHHGWLSKKILGFRWSKKAKITLETMSFSRNISISIFKISFLLCIIEAYQ